MKMSYASNSKSRPNMNLISEESDHDMEKVSTPKYNQKEDLKKIIIQATSMKLVGP